MNSYSNIQDRMLRYYKIECLRHFQVSNYRIMIRIRRGKLPALQDFQTGIGKDIVDPQRWRQVHISTTDTEASLYKCILPPAPDGKIGIGVRDIVEIPANDCRIGTFIQLPPHRIHLVCPMPVGDPQFFYDRPASLQDAVINIFNDLDVM